MSKYMSGPDKAIKSYILLKMDEHPTATKGLPNDAVDYMISKHKKMTARIITISKLNHRDDSKDFCFEDRIPLG